MRPQAPRHWRDWSDEIFAVISGGFNHDTYQQALQRWAMDHPGAPPEAIAHARQRLWAHFATARERVEDSPSAGP